MRKNYLKLALLSLMLGCTSMLCAIERPHYPTQTPVDGGKYVLANLAVPTGYMSRTGWDGAYYFLGETDSHYAEHAFMAHEADGRWFFTTFQYTEEMEEGDEEPTIRYKYMGFPSGSGNLNGNLDEEAYFELLAGTHDGFYYLRAAEGNNPLTQDLNVHLNAGGQYFVISEPSSSWYPDFFGGVKTEEDGTPVYVCDEATGQTLQVMADSTSMNWAFVLVEDLPVFVCLGNAYSYLDNFEKNYCGLAGYETGFRATLTAVLPLYNAEDFTQETYEAMREQVQAKVNLYNQLLKAEELEAEELGEAIATAKAAFDILVETEALNEALAALTKACNDYSRNLDNITSMGQNMSFEDLSVQNGVTTTGVAPTPFGWEEYINGEKIESNFGNYFANWHGVNEDCDGYKDGKYGFGLWTPRVPDYELSQTITGLENGTYTVTAGLMLDYRRTTQRIFGNLNSTLFSYEDSYAEGILPGEYKTYAELTECTDERTMQEISVRAYVYDGTLRFGIKTDGDFAAALRETGADGDGWFKVDNFTIMKEGFIEEDQLALYDYLRTTLEDIASRPMDANYKDKYNVDYYDKDKGIAELATMIPEAHAQAQAYEPLGRAIEQAQENAAMCEDAGYMGVDDFYDVIDRVVTGYENGDYTAEEVADAVAELEEAYQACLRSGIDEGADVSDLIVNRSFENLSNQGNVNSDNTQPAPFGWTLRVNGIVCETVADLNAQGINGWCAINSGDGLDIEENGVHHTYQYTDGTHLWGIWNTRMPQVELSQTLTGLKPGTYLLTADVMVDGANWAGNNLTTQRIFANDAICLYGLENYDYYPELLQGTTSDDIHRTWNLTVNEGKFLDENQELEYINYGGYDATYHGALLRTLVLHFGVDESGTATIGFRTDNLDATTAEPKLNASGEELPGAGWFKLDNFTLYYESSQIPTKVDTVEKAQPAADAPVYDLSGRRVANPSTTQKGFYITEGRKIVK